MESTVATLWQLPLSLLSYAVQRGVRALFLAGAARRWRRPHAQGECRWRGLSELLARAETRWFVMSVGPRWNCHAVLADLGPLRVERTLAIEPTAPLRPGQHLGFVVYDRHYQTVGHIACAHRDAGDVAALVPVHVPAPGIYRVSARLYGFEASDACPAVRIDGALSIPASPVGAEARHYEQALRELPRHRSALLGFLHYHVYHALRWRRWIGEARLARLFVPVGNPATAFKFGVIERGQRLVLGGLPGAADGALPRTFVACYDRCSLPVYWAEAAGNAFSSPAMAQAGYFLVRVIAASEAAAASAAQRLRWHCE